MDLSILHLSDLHRDPRNEITNDALLQSLERDRERYIHETPQIRSPDLILVSGDLIQGVQPDVPEALAEFERQYHDAYQFLSALANSFVDGDKGRVVLVPGNPDVSWLHSSQSMKELSLERSNPSSREIIARHVSTLFSPDSPLRWSWKSLSFLEIEDKELYARRLELFCAFYQRFYDGRRSFDLDPSNQFSIFDYPDFNLAVVAFSSCHNNDHLNPQGTIHPTAFARALKNLQHIKYRGRLLLAVWHHNTSGGPIDKDYIAPDVLQVLIDNGFSLAFHGHQHRPQFIDERFQFGGGRKINVVSAGSLCAGPSALRPGHPRGYNVLELNVRELKARLHLRQMQNEDFGLPIWMRGVLPITQKSFIDFSVQPAPEAADDALTVRAIVTEAEEHIGRGEYGKAVQLLLPAKDDPLARRLLLESCVKLDDTPSLVEHFYPPMSSAEIVHVADALWVEKRHDLLRALLSQDEVRDSRDAAVTEVRSKYAQRLGI